MDLAQIGASDDTIGLAIKRITEGDGLIDDLLKFARSWVVVESLFNNIGK
jgi:hypothetical protein